MNSCPALHSLAVTNSTSKKITSEFSSPSPFHSLVWFSLPFSELSTVSPQCLLAHHIVSASTMLPWLGFVQMQFSTPNSGDLPVPLSMWILPFLHRDSASLLRASLMLREAYSHFLSLRLPFYHFLNIKKCQSRSINTRKHSTCQMFSIGLPRCTFHSSSAYSWLQETDPYGLHG